MSRFGYGATDESFIGNYPTREEALQAWMAEYPEAESLFTAEGRDPDISYQQIAEVALESLSEQLGEECGEPAENWDPPSQELTDAIATAIEDLVAQLQPISCWVATDVREHAIPQPATDTRQ